MSSSAFFRVSFAFAELERTLEIFFNSHFCGLRGRLWSFVPSEQVLLCWIRSVGKFPKVSFCNRNNADLCLHIIATCKDALINSVID